MLHVFAKTRVEFPFFRQQMAQRMFLSDIAKQSVGWESVPMGGPIQGEGRDEMSLLCSTSLAVACSLEMDFRNRNFREMKSCDGFFIRRIRCVLLGM